MAGEIIRMGDPTSHGGRVIEGSMADICHGKPIAFMGHQTYCPQCKGNFPIIDGAPVTTFYGKGVALAGMKTACGAVLIATQLTDIVEHASGGSAGADSGAGRRAQAGDRSGAASVAAAASSVPGKASIAAAEKYDLYFHVTDSAGNSMIDWSYRIEVAGSEPLEGRTDGKGHTRKVASSAAAQAFLYVYAPEVAPINPHWDR